MGCFILCVFTAAKQFPHEDSNAVFHCCACVVSGLIGPMNSAVSMAVGEMLPRIPASTISMRSASPSLSNKNLYPTFLRTDQSASTFARVILAQLPSVLTQFHHKSMAQLPSVLTQFHHKSMAQLPSILTQFHHESMAQLPMSVDTVPSQEYGIVTISVDTVSS